MRIAVVGTGIAGLGAAYALSRAHEVELFEKDDRPGGHTNTVVHDGLALDTGFVVHNEPNYPHLVRLFRELGVRTQDSEMSFSVSCARHGLEYAGRRPFGRAPLRLVAEIVRFLRGARDTIESAREQTVGAYVAEHGYSAQFRDHFLVPLTAALWSSGTGAALEFPAGYALGFFDHHGMLGFRRRVWRTVVGGSRAYVQALLERSRATVHLGLPVRAVTRHDGAVELRTGDGEARSFDGVVLAVHGDQALPLLADPGDDERRVLSAFRSTANETVLHTDERLLPRPGVRASWNYRLADCGSPNGHPTITYYLNRLQRLDADRHYCVTLNRTAEIAEEHVIRRISYEHPLYTFESLRAQSGLPGLNGRRRTAFAGAWQGVGFHEDGLASGLRAAAAFGVEW
jgi:predicted NAD/FAD-binding protein